MLNDNAINMRLSDEDIKLLNELIVFYMLDSKSAVIRLLIRKAIKDNKIHISKTKA